MSRSFRRSPYIGPASWNSDKRWKRSWHGEARAAIRVALRHFDADKDFLPHHREVSDVWESCKETKARFDSREHPKLMRK